MAELNEKIQSAIIQELNLAKSNLWTFTVDYAVMPHTTDIGVAEELIGPLPEGWKFVGMYALSYKRVTHLCFERTVVQKEKSITKSWSNLPCTHQINDVVQVVLPQQDGSNFVIQNCEIDAVKFYASGMVNYNVWVPVAGKENLIYLDNLDIAFINSPINTIQSNGHPLTEEEREMEDKIESFFQKQCAIVMNGEAIFGGKIHCVIFPSSTSKQFDNGGLRFDVAIPIKQNPSNSQWFKDLHGTNVYMDEELTHLKNNYRSIADSDFIGFSEYSGLAIYESDEYAQDREGVYWLKSEEK